jgi:hypothetical protein
VALRWNDLMAFALKPTHRQQSASFADPVK